MVTQILRVQRKICWHWKTPQLSLEIIFLKVLLRIVPTIENSLRGWFFLFVCFISMLDISMPLFFFFLGYAVIHSCAKIAK